jgi:uncharacterized protein (DUF1919 family)
VDSGKFFRNPVYALKWHYTRVADDFEWRFSDRYLSWQKRRRLKVKDFTILSNDCVAGVIYHRLGVKYMSPTVWTFIFPDEYIRLLGNLKWYLSQPLTFTDHPKHTCTVHDRLGRILNDRVYPVGLLGGDVEIHFLHCRTEEEAKAMWSRRLQRINMDRLYAVLVDNEYYDFKDEHFEAFDKLPLQHKLFVSKQKRDCAYSVVIANKMHLERSVDLVKWLNCDLDWQR